MKGVSLFITPHTSIDELDIKTWILDSYWCIEDEEFCEFLY